MIKRGEIWLVSLDPTVGHEINKTRPSIVIQNDVGNEYSKLTTIAPITSKNIERIYPTDVFIPREKGLEKDSKVLLSQIRAIDKRRMIKCLGKIDADIQLQIDEAIKMSLGLIKTD